MDLARRRLVRTLLAASSFRTGREVVRALGAVQAQDYEGAKWALALRAPGVTDADLEREFTAGEIVRTHVLRPTWHFVDPAEVRWMLALTGPHVRRRMLPYDRRLGLDESVVRRSNRALERALRDGAFLTRAEIKEVLVRARVGPPDVQRTAHLLMRAELDGVIISGPRKGRQFTYALLEARVASTEALDHDAALARLARRYFTTRAPATAADFAWWSGLPMAEVKRAIGAAGTALSAVRIDGVTYHEPPGGPGRARASAFLLPNYDEFFIGYRDRGAIGRRLGSTRIVTGGSALIGNVVVVDGQLVGGWRRTRLGGRSTLVVSLLSALTPGERSRVASAARHLARFLGEPVEVRGLAAPAARAARRRRS